MIVAVAICLPFLCRPRLGLCPNPSDIYSESQDIEDNSLVTVGRCVSLRPGPLSLIGARHFARNKQSDILLNCYGLQLSAATGAHYMSVSLVNCKQDPFLVVLTIS